MKKRVRSLDLQPPLRKVVEAPSMVKQASAFSGARIADLGQGLFAGLIKMFPLAGS
jgi:hypothetical protein